MPILFDAGTFLVSAGLIASMTGTYAASGRRRATSADAKPTMRADIREGLSWLGANPLLRSLAILLGFMNGTGMMLFSLFTLYAVDEESILGLGPVGFSVLLTTAAVGSILGSLVAERLVARFGRGPNLWLALVAAVVVPLAIGLTSSLAVVALAWVVYGFTGVVWNVITVSLRQTIIPDDLLGRVNSVYRFLGWGSMPIGSLLGGLLAARFGLRAPFLGAAAIMALAILPFARQITSANIERVRSAAA